MRMFYGYLFSEDIKEIAGGLNPKYTDLIDTLNAEYQEEVSGIMFGDFDHKNHECYIFAGLEITCDIDLDAEDHKFSIDPDQIKENDTDLEDFLESHPELESYLFTSSPRIFFF